MYEINAFYNQTQLDSFVELLFCVGNDLFSHVDILEAELYQ